MAWTHRVCMDCWMKHNPDRRPTRMNQWEYATCCVCGNKRNIDIYVRAHKDEMPFCEDD